MLPSWYDDWVLLERERLRQLRMHAWEALSEKLVRAGRYGEALLAYHRFEQRLADELGLAPSPHLTAMVRGLGRTPVGYRHD